MAGVGSSTDGRRSGPGPATLAAELSADWAFGTARNSARIVRGRPHENPAKTKMSTPVETASDVESSVIAFRGADAARFLQGQLSADMEKLATGARTLA